MPSGENDMQQLAESQLAQQQFHLFLSDYDATHDAWMRESEKFDRFYFGDQWEESVKSQLEAEGRPALTINLVLGTINVLLGEQSSKRVDIQYKNRRGGSENIGATLTKKAMAVTDENKYAWLESQMFADGLIQDRGWIDARMDWSTGEPNGRIQMECVDPAEVVLPSEAGSWDPKDWPRVWRYRWVSLADIARQYGEEYARKLYHVAEQGHSYGHHSIRENPAYFGGSAAPVDRPDYEHLSEEIKWLRKSVRVIEQQFRKGVRVHYLVDPESGERRQLPLGAKLSEAKKIAKQFGTYIQSTNEERIRWRITADRFVLHDDWSPYRSFTLRPFFPYFRRGKPFGAVRNLISPQEQVNKLSSQELHIVNSTANSGWIVETGALVGMTPDDLADSGSKTGLVITTAVGRKDDVQKIQPNSIPTGLDRIGMKAANNIRQISGVSETMLGFDSPEVSGAALEKKEGRGQVQVQVPLDSLARTRQMVGEKLLELMQDWIIAEEEIQYTNHLEPGSPRESQVINQVNEDGSVSNDVSQGEYDVVIATMPPRDNMDQMQFAEALSLRNAGVQIPDYRVIQYSNLVQKDAVADEVRQLTGLGEIPPEEQERQARIKQLQDELAALEVQAKQAEIQEVMSQAELNLATARDKEGSEDRLRMTLEQKTAAEREGHAVRERVTAVQAINALDKTVIAGQLKNAGQKEPQKPTNQ